MSVIMICQCWPTLGY